MIKNLGTSALTVNSITLPNADFSISQSSFTIEPLSEKTVTLVYTPSSPTPVNGQISIASNDPNSPSIITVKSNPIHAPKLRWNTVSSINIVVNQGDSVQQDVSFSNTGLGTLDWFSSYSTQTPLDKLLENKSSNYTNAYRHKTLGDSIFYRDDFTEVGGMIWHKGKIIAATYDYGELAKAEKGCKGCGPSLYNVISYDVSSGERDTLFTVNYYAQSMATDGKSLWIGDVSNYRVHEYDFNGNEKSSFEMPDYYPFTWTGEHFIFYAEIYTEYVKTAEKKRDKGCKGCGYYEYGFIQYTKGGTPVDTILTDWDDDLAQLQWMDGFSTGKLMALYNYPPGNDKQAIGQYGYSMIQFEFMNDSLLVLDTIDLPDYGNSYIGLAHDGDKFIVSDWNGNIYGFDDGFWLNSNPAHGMLSASGTQTVTLFANSKGLAPGDYQLDYNISYFHPTEEKFSLPLTMKVIGDTEGNDPPSLFLPNMYFDEDNTIANFDLKKHMADPDHNISQLTLSAPQILNMTANKTDIENGWHYKIGTTDLTITVNASKIMTVSATGDSSGVFTVRFTVTDPLAASASQDITITVNPVDDPTQVVHPLSNISLNTYQQTIEIGLDSVFLDIDDIININLIGNTNPSLVGASLSANTLTLTPVAGVQGSSTITIRGNSVDDVFTFTVNDQTAPILNMAVHHSSESGFARFVKLFIQTNEVLTSSPALTIDGGAVTTAVQDATNKVYSASYEVEDFGNHVFKVELEDMYNNMSSDSINLNIQLAKVNENSRFSIDEQVTLNFMPGSFKNDALVMSEAKAIDKHAKTSVQYLSDAYEIKASQKLSASFNWEYAISNTGLDFREKRKIGLYKLNANNEWEYYSGIGSGDRLIAKVSDFGTYVVIYDKEAIAIPQEYKLHQNYPNPFNPTTTIAFDLVESSQVYVYIYNVLGQRVRTLVNGILEAGFKELVWDGRNENGSQLASGVYFYQIITPQFKSAKKMVLMK
ncbi:MAG: T9SS type A sorting domain-containing protein [Calditrichaeota bacterium]|nr:T9SS type A sorting domain-containing protein [Calditrichota bacterium]